MSKGQSRILSRRLLSAWVSSIISISLVLLLVGAASLLLVNAGKFSRYIKENMSVTVLMKQDVGENQALAFQSELDRSPWVKSSSYVSKQQGIQEMSQLLGEDFLDIFSSAPIPVSLELTLNGEYVVKDSLDMIKSQILASPLVDSVTYQENIVEALNENLARISMGIGLFILLLLFLSFVLINNTIRLNVYARRFTIHTMKMVGATKNFIRRPFMAQAFVQGLFSSMIACLALVGLLFFLKGQMLAFYDIFPLERVLAVLGIVLASGLLICLSSTWVTVGKMVGLDKDELYF
ncbi:MAG: permease-like cell division protein FtsX [Bacteroidales bacterium]|nr:permease-like cell division protein FtsX [Bacteroidales bacterium]